MKSRVIVDLDDKLENRRPRSGARSALQLSLFVNAGRGNAACITGRRAYPSAGTARRDAENILRCKVLDAAAAVGRGGKNDAELEGSTANFIRETKSKL